MESGVSPLLRPYLSLLIILPKSKGIAKEELDAMIQDINEREVTPEERLSDNVYEYSAATKEIVIAGNDPRQKESVEHIR